jgi:hypothetical protein
MAHTDTVNSLNETINQSITIVALLLHINNQNCVSSTIEVVSYEEESFIGVRAGKGKGFDSKKAKVSTRNRLP